MAPFLRGLLRADHQGRPGGVPEDLCPPVLGETHQLLPQGEFSVENGPGRAVVLRRGPGHSPCVDFSLGGVRIFLTGVGGMGGDREGRISQILRETGEGGGELEVELSSECLLGRRWVPNFRIKFGALKIVSSETCVIFPPSCLVERCCRSARR